MKKVVFTILFTLALCFCTNAREAFAEGADYEWDVVQAEEISFDNVKQVIETETIYDVPEIMLLSDYEIVPFEKVMYLNATMGNGTSQQICGVKLSGVFYYYDDGKVHLYSLNTTSYVYEAGGSLQKVSSSIVNTDGSYSEGIVVFNYSSPGYGFFACEATVEFTENSMVVNSGLSVLTHTLP